MDESKDFKAPPANPETAGNPADPAVAPKIALASIDSPAIAPTMADMTADLAPDMGGIHAPKIARPPAAESFEAPKPESPGDPAPVSRDIIPLPAPTAGRASRKLSKFTLLAASVVL